MRLLRKKGHLAPLPAAPYFVHALLSLSFLTDARTDSRGSIQVDWAAARPRPLFSPQDGRHRGRWRASAGGQRPFLRAAQLVSSSTIGRAPRLRRRPLVAARPSAARFLLSRIVSML